MRSAQNLCFVVNRFYALFRLNGSSKPSLTSKPLLTIALKILKTIEKPLVPMVGPPKKHSMVMVQLCQNHWKTIDGNGGLKKNINHSIALKNWPSLWSISKALDQIVFFSSWPYPRRVFQCIRLEITFWYGVPYEMVLRNIYSLVILALVDAVLHLLVVDSLVLLDRSLGGVRSRCSRFPQSLARSWVIRDTSPQLLSMSLLPTS